MSVNGATPPAADTPATRATSAATSHPRATRCIVAGVVALCLAGCASSSKTTSAQSTPTTVTTTKTKAAAKPVTEAPLSTLAGTILSSSVRTTSFSQVKKAIDELYKRHPGLYQFTYQDVTYTPSARDEVLDVCREGGGLAKTATAVESSKVLGCAPLIFFFYSYGQKSLAPDSVAVARDLYWYASTQIHGPFDAQSTLGSMLSGWGIH